MRTNFERCLLSTEKGNKIDWSKVTKENTERVYIRVGYGIDSSYQDDKYTEESVQQCNEKGIPYDFIFDSYSTGTEQSMSEAYHLKRVIKETHATPERVFYHLKQNYSKVGTMCVTVDTFCMEAQLMGAEKFDVKVLYDSSLEMFIRKLGIDYRWDCNVYPFEA